MFNKILIANRGEIAVRIIRACKELGVKTVAVYSETDKYALHAQLADEAVCIGGPSPKDSYLNMHNILSATVLTGAQAIHPGFGFLSENSKFANMCRECNIVFIGPDPETIEELGNKSKAKETMKIAGVPVIPGSDGAVADEKDAFDFAQNIGYPLMIKASAGGGGRGIRIVREASEFLSAFRTARAEAEGAFGDGSMYIEKFIEKPKHIEFQILADNYGNVLHLGERDCSIQRRNQKVLEEAPSTILSDELRKEMGQSAVKAAKIVGYKNAGTIEFLVDKNKNYYFMEMNTRVQVEHPITEFITGIDIVKQQIRIAAGEKLELKQQEIIFKGHSIECRINAESPEKGFRPSPGTIQEWHVPGGIGIRVDSAAYSGYTIPPNYDSMIAKLISYGENREEAITRMRRALEEFYIEGIDTNIEFQLKILNNNNYNAGEFDTGFIAKEFNL